MRRAISEQPRVAIAKTLGALFLVAVGIAGGALLASGDHEVPRATQVRLVSAERAARDNSAALDASRAKLKDESALLARAKRRSKALKRTNIRLRRDLRRARRSLRRARRQP
ncbi:MAG: hypothetical protein M3401_16575 [Actinomycetota bacterium]|nr:hypothetical protein [Actinomycetota bacterium]